MALKSDLSTRIALTEWLWFRESFYLWEQPIGCHCLQRLSFCCRAQGAASATTAPAETRRTGWHISRLTVSIQTRHSENTSTAQHKPYFCLAAGDWRRLWWPEDIGPAAFRCSCHTAPFWWHRGGAGWSPIRVPLTDAPSEARRSPQTAMDHTGETGDTGTQEKFRLKITGGEVRIKWDF